ncbi:hypothetical protein BAUCODRAFT_126034 [Baudoinia panamericana UAMH 10762]|uniref:Uncharacterized protein n=1 Tax=Baudoinia panamericana (strain UAMH 10762) TaxID=717646 RepID=M2M6X6_BAUPA|nr:uncharacterized protein BAUCODRAFT_126034 [Baudoinia panamericana UAMH 10762]EMC92016.1 hypothetical protein BAUCODRAFT_126034 [Baudoinia panamericana UAMH 10762]
MALSMMAEAQVTVRHAPQSIFSVEVGLLLANLSKQSYEAFSLPSWTAPFTVSALSALDVPTSVISTSLALSRIPRRPSRMGVDLGFISHGLWCLGAQMLQAFRHSSLSDHPFPECRLPTH